MKLIRRMFARSDRRRARDCLQEICDERVKALRALDKAKRDADRALQDAQELEREQFREEFFGKRNPVRSAFIGDMA
jgi:hypothetical protein